MRPQPTNFRSISSKILLCAALLIIVGFATQQLKTDGTNAGQALWTQAPAILSPAAVLVGSVLAFVAAVRMSLFMRPLHLLFFGILLIIAAFTIPILASQFFPAIETYHWAGAFGAPLYACDFAGIVFVSTGVLRLLSGK